MTSPGFHRAYAEERVISGDPWPAKMIILIGSVGAMLFCFGLDLIDHDHMYFLRSMLASIVGLGLIASMYRYVANFVDEVRAGPGYLVARRRGLTSIVSLEQIAKVRFNAFVPLWQNILYKTRSGFFERFEVRLSGPSEVGEIFAFRPQSAWRKTWPQDPPFSVLRGGVPDNINF